MNNIVYGKTVEGSADVRLIRNKKDRLKWISKPSYMSQKIIDNEFVAILKIKIILKHTLSKILIFEFHYDYKEIEK